MRFKVLAWVGFVVSATAALIPGLVFAVAWADSGALGCRDFSPADWLMMNSNCRDASSIMWGMGPFAALGLLGIGLSAWGMRRA